MATQTQRFLYRIPDGAEMVGISRSTFYKLMRDGEIETVMLGRRRLVAHESLERLAERIRSGDVTMPSS
jgi:excisionase family DNA binding protein